MKKKLSLALALTLALGLTACSGGAGSAGGSSTSGSGSVIGGADGSTSIEVTDSDLQYIKDKGVLVVGITEFAPMDYQDADGNWIGFDADMASRVAEDLGVEVQFSVIDWDNKLLELNNKSVDCLWNGMTITEDIINAASPTNAYAKNAQVVVLKSEVADQYTTEESIRDLTFAVEGGSSGEEVAEEMGLSYNSVLSQADALMEVAAGTSDACIIDLLMSQAMIGEGTSYPDLTYTVSLSEEEYGVGCRQGSDLTDYINEEFKTLYAEGFMTELGETYGIAQSVIPQE